MSEAEEQIAATVRAAAGNVPVLLCGSRARGDAGPGSDWDVVAVLPLVRIPLALGRLRRMGEELSAELGAPVSVNPLPAGRLRRVGDSLFVWKLAREARVLAAPRGFALPTAGEPPVTEATAFSYLASAALFLFQPEGARKALLHVAQLRLMRRGKYESGLAEALAAAGDERLTVAAAAAGEEA